MQIREFLEYCNEHNVPDWANIGFENLDYCGYVYADKLEYDEDNECLNLSINPWSSLKK